MQKEISQENEKFRTYENTHTQADEYNEEALAEETSSNNPVNRVSAEIQAELFNDEATYKLFETVDERRLRLEQKWLQNRLKDLEEGAQFDKKLEGLKSTVESFRRLKYRLDQKAYLDGKRVFFEEHKVFVQDEKDEEERNRFLVDEEVVQENLFNYLKQKNTVKRLT